MRKIWDYLKARGALIALYLCVVAILTMMGVLAGLEETYTRYCVVLVSFSFFVIMLIDGLRYRRARRSMAILKGRTELLPDALPEPMDALSADYDAILRALSNQYHAFGEQSRREAEERLSYYTIWVHQIKTPIAAMRLLINELPDDASALSLKSELFNIEQYASLALQFVRLRNLSGDLIVEPCELDLIVRAAIRKVSLLFIKSRLSVFYESSGEIVRTDAKWFEFILVQVLTNAVKYTRTGGVDIAYRDGALLVRDTGIGIRQEDLPRIFEKGYTGYNGRLDTRASGVGLYLVKRAAYALSIGIEVSSEVGKGTCVSMRFPPEDVFAAHS